MNIMISMRLIIMHGVGSPAIPSYIYSNIV